MNSDLPHLVTPVPGPRSEALVDVLARHECPAITARRARRAASMGRASNDPVVWSTASGANVWDADGNRFVDMTSGFGVALVGHRDPAVVAAARTQSERLLHAMGDAYPDETRIQLLEALAHAAPHGISHAILGLSGADAVDGAVKTAVLATGRPGVLSFRGGYHGLSLGTVPLQGYKAAFSDPFAGITNPHVEHLPFHAELQQVEDVLKQGNTGLVLIEPIQGRGGIRVASHDWIRAVADCAHRYGALVAFDEIQCGLGRTGDVWAGPANPVDGPPVVDLLCVGKQLGGGFPISATMGTEAVMNAWGASVGEALHTQTFLGHPMGCATALTVLERLDTICAAATDRGARLQSALVDRGFPVQGRGLMLGVGLADPLPASRALLERGYIAFPAGMRAEVLALTPPMVLSDAQIDDFASVLSDVAQPASGATP